MKKLYTILFLTAFGISSMVNAQTWSGFNDADVNDSNWSTLGNWVDNRIPIPGYTAQIYNNVTAVNVDTDSSIKNLSNATSRLATDGNATLSGANTITIDINNGSNANAIFNQSNEETTFKIDCNVTISNALAGQSYLTISGNASNILEFGSSSTLELIGNGITSVRGASLGEFHFNGTITGTQGLLFGVDTNTVFGATSDPSAFTGSLTFSPRASVTINSAANLTIVCEKIQANGSDGILTLKNENAVTPDEIRVGTGTKNRTLTINVEANQTFKIIKMPGTSTLNLDLGVGVTEVAFAVNNIAANWGNSTLNITGFQEGVIRFGTDNTSLDSGNELDHITHDGVGGALALNASGYLIYASSLSVQDHSAFDFAIYPNPVKDMLHINTQESLEKIEVADLLGRTVFKQNNVSKSVDISSLNKGVYILKLTSEKGVSTKKIIKE